MIRLYRALVPSLQYAVIGLVCALAVSFGVHYVTVAHRARQAESRVCAAKIEAVKARHLFMERYLCQADPCQCLLVLTGRGEDRRAP